MLLQMTLFHSVLHLSNIPLCICTKSSLPLHLLVDICCFHVFQSLWVVSAELHQVTSPRSVHWSASFSIQLLCTPAGVYFGFGSAMSWQRSSVLVSVCPGCSKLAAALSSEPLSFPNSLSWFPSHWRRLPGWGKEEPFPCIAPSQGHGSHPDFFYFSFIPHSYMVIFLAALVVWHLLPAFRGYSVRTAPHVDVFFTYLWEEVNSTPFYSAILISPVAELSMRWAFQKYLESE